MSQTARKLTHISAADDLAAENDGLWRHEPVDGAVYAMAARAAGTTWFADATPYETGHGQSSAARQ